MRTARAVSTLALASTALLGVAAGPLAGTAAAGTRVVTYHAVDNGKTITVSRGTVFKIKLHYCGDCGQSWVFAQRPAATVVAFEGRKNTSTATPPAVGGENDAYWTFKAVGKGQTTIRLAEHSAAKKNDGVIKRFSLTVHVT